MANLLLLLSFEVIISFVAYFLNENDIMAPAVMMAVMFIISTCFTISSVEAWGVDFGFDSLLILSSGILTFIIANASYKLTHSNFKLRFIDYNSTNCETPEIEPIVINKWVLISLFIFSVVCLGWYDAEIRRITGRSGSVFGTVAGLFRARTSHNSLSEGFEGINLFLNQLLKIVDALGYVCEYLLVHNALSRKKLKKDRNDQIYLLSIVVISFLPSFMTANRGNMLQKLSALLLYWYVIWNEKYNWKRNLSLKFVRIGMVIIVLGIPTFYYTLNLIGRASNMNMDLMDYTAKYVGSSIYEFDLYVKNPSAPPRVFGEESLIAVDAFLYRLGMVSFVRDVNLEKRGAMSSNVYTFFRRPLHDFGLGGMYIFTFLCGLFFSWLYDGKVKRRNNNHCWIISMGYFYYWIILTSIEQCSFMYASFTTGVKLVSFFYLFKLMTTKFKLRIKR